MPKTVAVLESRLGPQVTELVRRRGYTALHAPALAEMPDIDPQQIATLVAAWEKAPVRVAIFQTGVGVQALFKTTDALGLSERLTALLGQTTVVVRGPKPTGALKWRNIRIDLSAADPFTTHEVLAAIAGVDLRGQRVVVQRYGAKNRELETALRQHGAEVVEIPVYRWSLPADLGPLRRLIDEIDAGRVDAALFTSASQLLNLFAVADGMERHQALRDGLNRLLVASVGPVCSAALIDAGVKVGLEASPPKLGPLIEALDKALAGN